MIYNFASPDGHYIIIRLFEKWNIGVVGSGLGYLDLFGARKGLMGRA
jgi:hypothetical protein